MTTVLSPSDAGPRVGPAPSPPVAGSARWATVRGKPVLWATLVGVLGLAVMVGGYALGWAGVAYAPSILFYVGIVVVVAPCTAVLLGPGARDAQRQAAVAVLGLLMYGAWVLADPVYFSAFDETLHVRTLVDLVDGAGFFADNTMLPVSPHYPGLELATSAVHWLTGLPLVASGIVVVAVSRVALVLALFHVATKVCRSARAGGIVVLLYAGSVQFYFFNAQFSYQTVALAMILGTLYFVLRATEADPAGPRSHTVLPMVAAQLCLAALAITHHLSSWIGLASLWALALLFALGGERRRARLMAVTAAIGTVVIACWSAVVIPLLLDYLGPVFNQAGTQIDNFLNSDGGGRKVLGGSGGNATPVWESALMFGSVLLWCLPLLPALWGAHRGSTIKRSMARVMLIDVAITFPVLFLLRFVPAAAEVGDRASTFVTLTAAIVVGGWLASRVDRIGLSVAVPAMVVLILGGVILGSGPDWQRVPGPYLAGAEQRSVDSETMAVAQWAGEYLPAGSRIAADVTMSRVLPTVAPVDAVTSTGGSVNMTELFISTQLSDYTTQLIEQGQVDFVVVDTRMIGHTVLSGSFFEGSASYGKVANTMTARQLDKFQDAPGYDLVLDGPVRVYDVRGLRGLPETYADRAPPGLPGSWHPLQVGLVGAGALLALALARRQRWRGFGSHATAAHAIVALPLLMALGALGVEVGFSAVTGTLLALIAIGAALYAARTGLPATEPVPARSWVPWTAAIGVVLAVTVAVAGLSAYHGLFDHAPLPAPDLANLTGTAATVDAAGR